MFLSICDNPDILATFRIIKIVIQVIKIVVPIALIVSGALTFAKATASGENNKAIQSFIRKGIAAAAIFLIPTFVGIIAKATSGDLDYMKCIANANSEGVDKAYSNQVDLVLSGLNATSITADEYNRAVNEVAKIQDPTLRAQAYAKLKTYKIYVEINEGLALLVNNNTKENRDKVQALINKLNDSDTNKKTFQNKLNKYGSSASQGSTPKSAGQNLGIESGYYKGHNGKLDYYVYFPPNATTNMPLLLWLHGDNPRVEWTTNNKIGKTAYKAGVPVIMVSPFAGSDFGQRSNPGWYEGGLLPNVKAIVEEVCNKYSCDRSNINIGGHSRGAIGTWMMVSQYPGYFHAAAPVSCCSVSGFKPESFSGVKVWAWRGSNKGSGDNNDNIYAGCMQSTINKIKPYAKHVNYTILPNTTHGEATDELQLSEEFARYMFSD